MTILKYQILNQAQHTIEAQWRRRSPFRIGPRQKGSPFCNSLISFIFFMGCNLNIQRDPVKNQIYLIILIVSCEISMHITCHIV